jgi:hypothetical protein
MHAPFISFQVHYGIYYLQMNTLLGSSSKEVVKKVIKIIKAMHAPTF